jgi:hypothetical protein
MLPITRRRYAPTLRLLLVSMLLVGAISASPPALYADDGWTPPVELSEDQSGWFPDLAADHTGAIHVIWGSGINMPTADDATKPSEAIDLLRYRALRDGVWTPMNDVVFTCTGGYTVRNSLTVNADGRLNALVRTCTDVSSMSVRPDEAWSAQGWSSPVNLGSSYYNALAADSRGRLHILYHELIFNNPERPGLLSEVYYRRSDDGGQSWSMRTNLADLPGGDERMQIKLDAQDRVHVVWDHGSDWYLGLDRPTQGVYRRSDDGGESWRPQIMLGVADEPSIQTSLAVNLDGNPLVVYRGTQTDRMFFQYSPDRGDTWSGAEQIPGLRARQDTTGRNLDQYSLVVDSANRIHLLAVGFPEQSNASIPMLLHLVWNGQAWSEPVIIAQGVNYPIWPRAVVAQGNQLHSVWFTYTDASDWGERRIWHSSKRLATPLLPPPTLISLPAAAAPTSPQSSSVEGAASLPAADAAVRQSAAFSDLPPPSTMQAQSNLIGIVFALVAVSGLLVSVTLLSLWRRARQ